MHPTDRKFGAVLDFILDALMPSSRPNVSRLLVDPPLIRWSPTSAATDRVLTTAELLGKILEYSNPAQNYRNALVSKNWSNEALNILWRTLPSLVPLLKLLGPMTSELDGVKMKFKYDRHIGPDDWGAFRRHVWRVHEIAHNNMEVDFSESVFIDIIATVTALSSSELVPNLRLLVVVGGGTLIKFTPLFIHNRLQSLFLVLDGDCPSPLPYKATLIPHKVPNLQELSLVSNSRMCPGADIDLALSTLPRLKKLLISTSQITTSTFMILARLPLLETLVMMGPELRDVRLITPTSLADVFPSLSTFFCLPYRLDTITSFLRVYKPRKLRRLRSTSYMDPPLAYRNLLETISLVCPSIQEINVDFFPLDEDDPDLNQPALPLPLSPTNPCPKLTSLQLTYPPCLQITASMMSALLLQMPSLVTLRLTGRHGPPTFPLSALSDLVPLCQKLKSLTIYVDTSSLSFPASPTCFPCLEVLNVDISPLNSSALGVASFLATILPPTCTLEHAHPSCAPTTEGEYNKWKPVIDFLPVMLRTVREMAAALATK
ncbi:hypothetical protein EYR38_002388 [Pleurotus pulmonarius]|nr:hypothetical protein EYR38_002388 [Pleurotus pulmonarius]